LEVGITGPGNAPKRLWKMDLTGRIYGTTLQLCKDNWRCSKFVFKLLKLRFLHIKWKWGNRYTQTQRPLKNIGLILRTPSVCLGFSNRVVVCISTGRFAPAYKHNDCELTLAWISALRPEIQAIPLIERYGHCRAPGSTRNDWGASRPAFPA